MPVELRIPSSGESITEVQVGQWRKAEGDAVEADEVIVEIETDKAAMDLPAPVSGVLVKILKKDGEPANVGDVIAHIEQGAKAAGKPAAPAQVKASESKPSGPSSAKPQAAPAASAQDSAAEPRVMPAARRVLAEHDLDAKDVPATGPGGRLLKEDVQRYVEQSPAKVPVPEVPGHVTDEREEEVVPMSPMRRVIARHLVEAQRTAALLTTFNEVDMSAVMELRQQHQEAFQAKYGIKLGFMSFFVKASIEALKSIPSINAEIRDNNIVYKNYYDIGIAVGGGRGLVVPVIRNAERLSFAAVEKAIAEFAVRAKNNQIELSELQGGTFTISNGGIYGSMLSTPIVNAPQSGILGLHRIQERPMAVKGQVVVRPMMYLALTYDHRLVDGREAVTFLRQIKELIEEPVRILIEV